MSSTKRLHEWQKILLALIAGVICGYFLGPHANYLKPIGILFIRAIQMTIVPVIFTAITCAVLSMQDLKKMRRISLKAILLYAISMVVASCFGLTMATIISPGKHFPLNNLQVMQAPAMPTLTEMIVNIIPTNPVAALASGNILQLLVFAIALGIAINLAGERAKPVANLLQSFASVTFKLTQIVMQFAPLGIFALIAWVTGEYGLTALLPLMKLIMTIYLSCFLLFIFYYGLTLAIAKINPLHFFKNVREPLLMAYSTASSSATLPLTMQCAENQLGISKSLSGFLLPLGTTMNLNGLSIYLSVATVFTANIYGVELNWMQYITIVFTILLTAMGAGGIPGSTIVVIGAVLNSIGLPLGTISLIASVDRLNDMAGTTTNVCGDLYAALIVAKSENELVTNPSYIANKVIQQTL